MPKSRTLLLFLAGACLATTPVFAQSPEQLQALMAAKTKEQAKVDEKAKKPRPPSGSTVKPEPPKPESPKPERPKTDRPKPAETPMPPEPSAAEKENRRADAAWAKVRDCDDVKRLARQFDRPAYSRRIADARARYCVPRQPAPPAVKLVPQPAQPAPPPRPTVDGAAQSAGRNPIELVINGRTIRLAGVIACNPQNDRGRLTALLEHPLICRPLGADYQCTTKDTNQDVARVSVEHGIAQPTGEDYENEYYAWKREVEKQSAGQQSKQQCLGGR